MCVLFDQPAPECRKQIQIFQIDTTDQVDILFLVDVALSATTSETCHSQSHQHEHFSHNYVQSIHNVFGGRKNSKFIGFNELIDHAKIVMIVTVSKFFFLRGPKDGKDFHQRCT